MKILNEQYEMVPVSMLETNPNNPRRGDVSMIAESIRENGFWGTIVVQKDTNRILAGNHRYLAAINEGAPEIPVVWVEVDEEQANRILVADNRLSDLATYDEAVLGALLKDLAESSRGLAGTGYNEDDIDTLLAAFDDDDHDGIGGSSSQPLPKLTITVEMTASEHLVDATRLIGELVAGHPEWEAKVV